MWKAKLLILGLFLSPISLAQSGASAISGTIKDVTGSVLPGARVRIVNDQSGAIQVTLSNETGLYRAGSLVPGSYRVEVEADGFQKLVRGPVTLEVGQVIALDLTLEI